MKLLEKYKAVQLRKRGCSYAHILKRVEVSKSTLSLWLRDIELMPNQRAKLLKGREASRHAAGAKKKKMRLAKTLQIISDAKKQFKLLIRNQIFLPGLALYWAEGDKHRQERIKFTNSDPQMIAFMMRWFREICRVPEDKFRIALHVHALHVQRNVRSYWAKITKVPKQRFQKIYVKPTSLGQRRNILYKGTCAVVVNNKDLFRRISGWKTALVEYFNAV